MTEDYFKNCHSVEEIKIRYRNLAKQHHPDLGGDPDIMKQVNAAYHEALKKAHGQTSEGRTYQYKPDIETELMDKLQELLKLRGLTIALIGYWIGLQAIPKPIKKRSNKLVLSGMLNANAGITNRKTGNASIKAKAILMNWLRNMAIKAFKPLRKSICL